MRQSLGRFSILRNSAGLAVCCALLAGCSVKTEPLLRSETGTLRSFSQIALIAPEAEQIHRLRLHNAVASALASQGIDANADSNAVGEVAIAVSPSTVGLYAGEASAPDDQSRPIADIRNERWYDGCGTARIKASLAVFDRGTGELIKRSQVERHICAEKELPAEELAQLLVSELTGN